MGGIDTSLHHLAATVAVNLKDQHDWISVDTHNDTHGTTSCPIIRPLLSGIPPRRLYVHPDEQIEALQSGLPSLQVSQAPEAEWVLPVHIKERLSLEQFAALFDSIQTLPPWGCAVASVNLPATEGRDWRGSARHKRFVLAVVHDDSTVSYYLMHDGVVKPRQN